jgi:hypothetical protein
MNNDRDEYLDMAGGLILQSLLFRALARLGVARWTTC